MQYEEKTYYNWCGCCRSFGLWIIGEQQQTGYTGNRADSADGAKRTNIRGGGTADLATPEADTANEETAQPEKEEQTETEKQTEETVEHRTGDNIVGISNKDITDISAVKYDTVRNDVTERWKCLVITENNFDITEYALSCYENHFDSDETILAVVNLTTKTSTSISNIGGLLYVSIYEYVDGEERDAKKMFGGMHLGDYIVYMDNGDIEKVTGIETNE